MVSCECQALLAEEEVEEEEEEYLDESEEEEEETDDPLQVHLKRKKKAPAKDGVEIIDMAVSVRVDTITSIDLEKQTFSGDLWVFVMTKDRIHEPVKREKVESFLQHFNPNTERGSHWIASQNLITAAAAEDHPKPDWYEKDGQLGLVWRLCGEFSEAWELQHFPFDCQDLTASFMIRYPTSDKLRMHFVQIENRLSFIRDTTFPSLSKTWHFPEKLIVHSSSKSDRWTNRQILHVTLEVRRHPGYYIWNIVIPMFLLVVMSGSTFFISPTKVQDRLSASLTLVLTAVAYKYNVVQTVPPIGHLTWLDAYNLMCYFFLFLVVVENCIACKYEDIESYTIPILCCGFGFSNLCFWIFACCAYRWPSRIAQQKLKRKELPMIQCPDIAVLSPRSFTCGDVADSDLEEGKGC